MFSIAPFFNFGKLFLDISTLTTGKPSAVTGTYSSGPGAPWSALFIPVISELLPTYGDGTIPKPTSPLISVYLLIMDCAIFAVLTWYCDAVVPNEFGYSLHPLFFLKADYWKGSEKPQDYRLWHKLQTSGVAKLSTRNEDAEVVREIKRVLDSGKPYLKKMTNLQSTLFI